MGALKTPKNLAQPKKCGKIKATPFLDVFEVSGSESEVRISIKILVVKLSNLMTLIVHNCICMKGSASWVLMVNIRYAVGGTFSRPLSESIMADNLRKC